VTPRGAGLLAVGAWLACVLAIVAAARADGSLAALAPGLVFVVLPVALTWRLRGDPLGVRVGPLGAALRLFVLLAGATLVPFVAIWAAAGDASWFPLAPIGPLSGAGRIAVALCLQTLAVALPEELFFRGYLQERWAEWRRARGGRAMSVLGAEVGGEVPAAALAFVIAHLPVHGAAGLLVLAPGLVFGWARARARSIWPGTLLHGVANALVLALTGAA